MPTEYPLMVASIDTNFKHGSELYLLKVWYCPEKIDKDILNNS